MTLTTVTLLFISRNKTLKFKNDYKFIKIYLSHVIIFLLTWLLDKNKNKEIYSRINHKWDSIYSFFYELSAFLCFWTITLQLCYQEVLSSSTFGHRQSIKLKIVQHLSIPKFMLDDFFHSRKIPIAICTNVIFWFQYFQIATKSS